MARTAGILVKSERSSSAPARFVRIGGTFLCGVSSYRVVLRPDGLSPADACVGCAFAQKGCPAVACSSFDRRDKRSVWFKKID